MEHNMHKDAVKHLLYGGLSELMQNSEYYYHSPVGSDYCHWTEEGERVMVGFVTIMATRMLEADQAQLDMRAKELVMDGLTK
jgi:hypothetical protein